jgi:hypothetical protein
MARESSHFYEGLARALEIHERQMLSDKAAKQDRARTGRCGARLIKPMSGVAKAATNLSVSFFAQ